ncbi:MAG: hypothetical protein H7Z76_04975 [Methylotenera sp.]|nr:hypothetical protein [Flavobacterium sp.]
MMIQAGEMNFVQAIVELEHRLSTLEKCYDFTLRNNFSVKGPSQIEIEKFRQDSLDELQRKYPSLGLQKM